MINKVILLHDNARPMLQNLSRTTWKILVGKYYLTPLIQTSAPSDYHLFRSMQHFRLLEQHFNSYEQVKKWIDDWLTSKDEQFYRRNSFIARKMGKSYS